MTLEELDNLVARGTGYVPDEPDARHFELEAFLGAGDMEQLPETFQIRVPFVTAQGGIPSCTAHATTTMKSVQEEVRLSPRFNYAWSKHNDGYKGYGTTFVNALSVLREYGAVEESDYPDQNTLPEPQYTNAALIPQSLMEKAATYKSKSYVAIPREVQKLKAALYKYFLPVLCGMEWFQSYNRIGKDGKIPEMQGSSVGHAFVCTGWTEDAFIFQNSFGPDWGDNGKFYVPQNELMRLYQSMFVTIDMPKEEAKVIVDEYRRTLPDPVFAKKWAGHILWAADSRGEVYWVNPKTHKRTELKFNTEGITEFVSKKLWVPMKMQDIQKIELI